MFQNNDKFYDIQYESIYKILKIDKNINEITFEIFDFEENVSFNILDLVEFENKLNAQELLPL